MAEGAPGIAPVVYGLTLYVTGATNRSLGAVQCVREFCERELHGCYELEVVDLYREPERARAADVIAAPTLIRHSPRPRRFAIGDMTRPGALRRAIKGAVGPGCPR